MEAFLDPGTKNIVKVIAEGDVRVVRGEDSTYSEKAIYTTEDQKIILVGKPRIYIHAPEEMEKILEYAKTKCYPSIKVFKGFMQMVRRGMFWKFFNPL